MPAYSEHEGGIPNMKKLIAILMTLALLVGVSTSALA